MDRRSRRGMTLLEVVLAVAILAFLIGGLSGIVRMALSSSATIEETEQRTREFTAFFRLCDQAFTALPVEAQLLRAASGEPASFSSISPGITLRDAPAAFAIDDADLFFGEIAVMTRQQNDGDLVLGVEYRQIDKQTNQILPKTRWIPLLRNLRAVEWAFYDTRTGKWQDDWSDTQHHPALVRLTLAPADGYPKETAVFSIPSLLKNSPGLSPFPSAPSPSGSSS